MITNMLNDIPGVLINLIKSYIPISCYYKDCPEIGSKLYIPNIFEGDPYYDRCYCCQEHYKYIREYFRHC